MDLHAAQATQAALNGVQSADAKRAGLQMLLLKKALEVQQEQAAELQKLAEGKGNVVDIRV